MRTKVRVEVRAEVNGGNGGASGGASEGVNGGEQRCKQRCERRCEWRYFDSTIKEVAIVGSHGSKASCINTKPSFLVINAAEEGNF